MQKRSNSVAIGDVSISADHHILPARRNHPCFWDSDKVNKCQLPSIEMDGLLDSIEEQ